MRFCNEHGMPHSKFLAWDRDDQAKAIAFMFEDAERCQLCGTAGWEWEADRNAYEPVLITCLGCYYKEVSREGQDIGPGVTVRLEKPGTMQAARRAVAQQRMARRDRAEARRRQAVN
jgi:hypothetical protein